MACSDSLKQEWGFIHVSAINCTCQGASFKFAAGALVVKVLGIK